MHILKNPRWLYRHIHNGKFVDIPDSTFEKINSQLANLCQHTPPLVSIVITAWNEEENLLNCVSSLAQSKTEKTFEILIVNNNSDDRTQDIIDRLDVRCVQQPVQGCGPARQLGQESAKGEFVLLADADCIYPDTWLDTMTDVLLKNKGVSCVYGSYSFIGRAGYPRWKLFILEAMRSLLTEFKHFKRPYLNAYGLNMGYRREFGIDVKYSDRNVRGTDGRLCFDLMQYGDVVKVRSVKARVWTGPRALERDGGYSKALLLRLKKEIKSMYSLLTAHPPHDTKKT